MKNICERVEIEIEFRVISIIADLDSLSLFLVIITTNWEFEIQSNADIGCFLSPT